MPNDNIKRTLDKYSGANGQVDYEANNYEGYGVGGVAVVVETLTDNKNRTVADVRHLFDKYGAGLGASGCVSWQFDKKGVIIMESGGLDEDAVMMQALDAGAEDFLVEEGAFEIYTAPDDFSTVREALEKRRLHLRRRPQLRDGSAELHHPREGRGYGPDAQAARQPRGQRRRAGRLAQLGE